MAKQIAVTSGSTRETIRTIVGEFMGIRRQGRDRVPTMVVESGNGDPQVYHNTAGGLRSRIGKFADEIELVNELESILANGGTIMMGHTEFREHPVDAADRRAARRRHREATRGTSRPRRGG